MAPPSKRNKIDEEIEESFPASDPPSFMGGDALGAPEGRQTVSPRKLRKSRRKARKPKARIKRKAATKKKPAAKKKSVATGRRNRR